MKARRRTLKYRHAQPSDAEALAEVYMLAIENATLCSYEHDDERQKIKASKAHDLERKLTQGGGYQGLMVSLKGQAVGFVCYQHKPQSIVHVEDLYALSKTGSALHKKLVMIEKEADTITLCATRSAQTAYEQWGYEHEMPDGYMKLAGSALKRWRKSMAGCFPRYPILPPDWAVPI